MTAADSAWLSFQEALRASQRAATASSRNIEPKSKTLYWIRQRPASEALELRRLDTLISRSNR